MKIGLKLTILFVSILLCMGSCITSKDTNFLQDIPKDYPQVAPSQYRIIPGDKLVVFVYPIDPETKLLFQQYQGPLSYDRNNYDTWYNPASVQNQLNLYQTKAFPVYSDGTIKFPYIGKVYVEGFTLLEARKILTEKLNEFSEGATAEVYLQNMYFSILGESGATRLNLSSPKTTIYQALATANALNVYSDISKVSIIRQTKDGSLIKTFDLRSKDIVDSDFYYIQANDVIYFPQASRKMVGATASFTGLFTIITSIASLVILIVRFI